LMPFKPSVFFEDSRNKKSARGLITRAPMICFPVFRL